MATDGGENNYHSGVGTGEGPSKLVLGDLQDQSKPSGASADSPISGADQQTTLDDKLRSGIYSQRDLPSEARESATGLGFGDFNAPAGVLRLDQSQIALSQLPELEIVDLAQTNLKSDASVGAAAQNDVSSISDGADDEDDDQFESYNGDRDTQEALARLNSVLSRDSEIPDQLLQTLDRLNRQETQSA